MPDFGYLRGGPARKNGHIVKSVIRKTVHFVIVLNNALKSTTMHYLIRKKKDCLSYYGLHNIYILGTSVFILYVV